MDEMHPPPIGVAALGGAPGRAPRAEVRNPPTTVGGIPIDDTPPGGPLNVQIPGTTSRPSVNALTAQAMSLADTAADESRELTAAQGSSSMHGMQKRCAEQLTSQLTEFSSQGENRPAPTTPSVSVSPRPTDDGNPIGRQTRSAEPTSWGEIFVALGRSSTVTTAAAPEPSACPACSPAPRSWSEASACPPTRTRPPRRGSPRPCSRPSTRSPRTRGVSPGTTSRRRLTPPSCPRATAQPERQ